VLIQLNKLAQRLAGSWRVVTTVGSVLTLVGVVLWGASQSALALASSTSSAYGAVSGASTTKPPAGAVLAASTPTTGAAIFWPVMILLVGFICVAVGLYLRRTSSQASQ
jgi:hypothetical protein